MISCSKPWFPDHVKLCRLQFCQKFLFVQHFANLQVNLKGFSCYGPKLLMMKSWSQLDIDIITLFNQLKMFIPACGAQHINFALLVYNANAALNSGGICEVQKMYRTYRLTPKMHRFPFLNSHTRLKALPKLDQWKRWWGGKSCWSALVSSRKCDELTMLMSPHSSAVNVFYDQVYDVIELQYRLKQRFLVNDVAKEITSRKRFYLSWIRFSNQHFF